MNTLQLQPRLKRLKLGGMLQTLELRLDQAHQEKLGHLEFLELMLEDEIQRRANKALANRIQRARFEEAQTLSDFDFAFNPKIPASQIRDLATCGFIERKESVLLVGPVGVGKTHIAQAIGHAACRQGRAVLFDKTARVLSDLGAGHLDATWERRLRRYLAPDLLILDDLGLRAFSERQGEDLYELISERVRRGSTIVTNWIAAFSMAGFPRICSGSSTSAIVVRGQRGKGLEGTQESCSQTHQIFRGPGGFRRRSLAVATVAQGRTGPRRGDGRCG